MLVQTKNGDLDELGERILYGVNKALRQLVEKSAANDESLVIGDDKGGFKSVPAKEILKTLPPQNA
jgi:hypothetical protein